MKLLQSMLLFSLLSLPAGQAEAQDWARKMFDREKIDFGVVARGADVVERVTVTNLYKETVHISNVRTTCGCSAATPSKTTLASRETATIEVKMDTLKFTKRKDSNVIVTIDAPYAAEVRIPVTAYIRTDVVLTPGRADFGAVAMGESAERKIAVAYAGRNDWKIVDVETSHPGIKAEVRETRRAGGRVDYDLIVSLVDSTTPGRIRDQLVLITDDSNAPRVPVLVDATIEADITVTPNAISLGLLKPGQTKRVTVVLRGREAFTIDKIGVDEHADAFRMMPPAAARAVHAVPITVTAPETEGDFADRVVVTIAGRPEPLTIPVTGKIMGPQTP